MKTKKDFKSTLLETMPAFTTKNKVGSLLFQCINEQEFQSWYTAIRAIIGYVHVKTKKSAIAHRIERIPPLEHDRQEKVLAIEDSNRTSRNVKALVISGKDSTLNDHLSSSERNALLPYKYTYNNYNPLEGINLKDGNLQNQGHLHGPYSCPETREFLFNFVNKSKASPLHTACSSTASSTNFTHFSQQHYHMNSRESGLSKDLERLQIVAYLIENGSKVDAQNEEGDTPLLCAIQSANYDVAKILTSRGCDITIRDFKNGYTVSDYLMFNSESSNSSSTIAKKKKSKNDTNSSKIANCPMVSDVHFDKIIKPIDPSIAISNSAAFESLYLNKRQREAQVKTLYDRPLYLPGCSYLSLYFEGITSSSMDSSLSSFTGPNNMESQQNKSMFEKVVATIKNESSEKAKTKWLPTSWQNPYLTISVYSNHTAYDKRNTLLHKMNNGLASFVSSSQVQNTIVDLNRTAKTVSESTDSAATTLVFGQENQSQDRSVVMNHNKKAKEETSGKPSLVKASLPNLPVSVGGMQAVENSQDICSPIAITRSHLLFGWNWHMQTPVENITPGSVIVIELRERIVSNFNSATSSFENKGKKPKLSSRLLGWTLIGMDTLRATNINLEKIPFYEGPVDLTFEEKKQRKLIKELVLSGSVSISKSSSTSTVIHEYEQMEKERKEVQRIKDGRSARATALNDLLKSVTENTPSS